MFSSQEVEYHLDSHVDCDGISHTPCQGSRGLWCNHNRVHKRVQNPGYCVDSKQVDCQEFRWVGQCIEESYCDERNNVLQVIQVAPANKFDTSDAAYLLPL